MSGACARTRLRCASRTCDASTGFRVPFFQMGAQYGRMDVSDAMRLRQIVELNTRLRKMAPEHAPDISILRAALSKNF